MKTIPSKHRAPVLDSRLAAYATLAGVALAAPAASQAAVVYSGPLNLNVPTTISGVYLNVGTGASGATPATVPGWDLNLWGTSTLYIYANNSASPSDGILQNFAGGSSATLVDNLPLGALVGAASSYGRSASIETSGATAFVVNSTANYFGFRFLNESTGLLNFGWAQISISGSFNGQPRSILAYAFEDSGAAINVGQTSSAVPESGSTLGLLAMVATGSVAVRAWRKRQAAV